MKCRPLDADDSECTLWKLNDPSVFPISHNLLESRLERRQIWYIRAWLHPSPPFADHAQANLKHSSGPSHHHHHHCHSRVPPGSITGLKIRSMCLKFDSTFSGTVSASSQRKMPFPHHRNVPRSYSNSSKTICRPHSTSSCPAQAGPSGRSQPAVYAPS